MQAQIARQNEIHNAQIFTKQNKSRVSAHNSMQTQSDKRPTTLNATHNVQKDNTQKFKDAVCE